MFSDNPNIEVNTGIIDKCVVISSYNFTITIVHNKNEIPNNLDANTCISVQYVRYFNRGCGELIFLDQDELVYKIIQEIKKNNLEKACNKLFDFLFEQVMEQENANC